MGTYTINQKFRAVPPALADRPQSDRQVRLAEMFGIGLDETCEVTLCEGLVLDVRQGDVVFITGPSGSGKSVLLRTLERAVRAAVPDGVQVVDLSRLLLPTDRPVIDLPSASFETALRLFSTAGLADAMALLRPADQLSDGQRYRLRLALALDRLLGEGPAPAQATADEDVPAFPHQTRVRPAQTARCRAAPRRRPSGRRGVLIADEFCSTLDRCCARALAYRVRRLVDRSRGDPNEHGLTVLAASAHDDLVEDLAPDVLIVKHDGEQVAVRYADPSREASAGGEGDR